MKILFKWQGSDRGEEGKRDCKCVLEKYTKEGYEFYTYVTVKDDRRGWKEVNYMQEVNSYPLPNTGCVVRVHSSGNVVHFHYNGQKAIEKNRYGQVKLLRRISF